MPANGNASAEGLGPGVSEVLSSFRKKGGEQHKTEPTKPTTATKPIGQFADAPYSMGAPGATSDGVDA